MKRCWIPLLLLLLSLAASAQMTPTDDSYTSTAAPTTNYGTAVTLNVNKATMTIGSNHLTTQVTGAAADNLNLDMTNANYNNLANLCAYISGSTGGKYTCSGLADPNRYTAATNVADVSAIDIKSAAYAAVLDQTRYYTFEVNGADADIRANLKNADGTPYSIDTFVYPWGSVVPDAAVSWLQSLNYLGSRSTLDWLTYPGWTTSAGIDLYGMLTTTGVNTLGQLAYLFYGNNCNDLSEDNRNFTCKNVTYSNKNIPPTADSSSYSAIFNGTSAYAQRTDASIDFHRGDGYWSAYIYPNTLTQKQTLFYHGTDDNNYHTLYLSASGTVVYSVVASGAEILHVETAAGLLQKATWQRVTLTFNQKTYKIFVGAPESVSVSSTSGPGSYTGPFTVGAGGSATLQNFYGGNIAGISFGTNAFASATAFFDTLASQGGVIFLYGHGDPGLPVPIQRILFQAKAASSANVMLDSYHNVLTDLRAHGTLANNRILTWQQADQSNYQLLPDSALIGAGTANGAPGTDFNGNPWNGPPSIGMFSYTSVNKRKSRSYWW
jgi:hypothetical protein